MKKIKSVFHTTMKLLSETYRLSRANIWFTLLSALIRVAKNAVTILMPAFLLNAIENAESFSYILGIVLVYTLIVIVADMTSKSFSLQLTALGYGLSNKAALTVGKKGMKIDYKHWENASSLDKSYKAMTSTWIFMGISDVIFENLFMAVASLAVTSYVVIQANPLVWPLILLLVGIGVWLDRKRSLAVHSLDMERAKEDKKTAYNKNILSDLKYGKEIRLFSAASFFHEKFEESSQKVLLSEKKKQRLNVKYGVISQILSFLESLIVYFFAIRQYARGLLSIGYFLTFFNAIREFSSALTALLQIWPDLSEIDDYYKNYSDYMEVSEAMQTGNKAIEKQDKCEIRFVHVYFRYPDSESYTLKDINLTIHSKEKIALVGENGSGKTTLIKLLLRLYDVTEGEILLNGINIKDYSYEAYLHLFAPIFQDYQLHAYSVRENIAFLDKGKDDRIWALLEENHMDSVIQKCPEGLETYTTKQLDENGRDFSGGEKQKLAMVRAQYKNANIFILDEPTSAIDPIAEMEFFNRVNTMMQNETVIYVSHRMASTKFADQIFVLKEGVIAEKGSYHDLMEADGIYAEMFKLQASYYNKPGEPR